MGAIAGRRPVLEALRGGRPLRRVLVAEGARDAPVLREILRAAAARGVPVGRVPAGEVERLAGGAAAQGVVALTAGFRYATLEEPLALASERGEPPLLVALDGVTDPRNLGAVARAAEGAGAHGLVVPRRRSAPVTPAAEKAAAGALAHLPVVQVPNLPRALEALRGRGVWVVALDAGADTEVWGLRLAPEPLCLVVGAEGRGVSRLVRERADLVAAIPMAGRVGSLNVAVAAGVALFEVRRLRRQANVGSGARGEG